MGLKPEPEIIAQHREQLAYLLTEAAEIEHGLMCCYLYAAYSLKRGASDGLTEAESAAVRRWRGAIIAVAVEEMLHLSLVSNLLTAIGFAPQFQRPNFPVAAGYHPSGIVVELAPFDLATLDHFIFLERPEGVEIPDGAGFDPPGPFQRATRGDRLMPSSEDYDTVGHLYRGIRAGFASLAARLGEPALFIGDPKAQVGPEILALPGLTAVTNLASALRAIDTIVEQGEGTQTDSERSHYTFPDGRTASLAACPMAVHLAVLDSPFRRDVPDDEVEGAIRALGCDVLQLESVACGDVVRLDGSELFESKTRRSYPILDAGHGRRDVLEKVIAVVARDGLCEGPARSAFDEIPNGADVAFVVDEDRAPPRQVLVARCHAFLDVVV